MAAKMRLMILGAPGSGKGTISSRIVKEFRLSHLSSGDLLRSNIEKKTPLGLKAKDYVSKGQLLPDDLITKLIIEEVKKLSRSSWLLDGFPRTISQAKSLESAKVEIDRVINLNVPFEVIINRLKHRWVHPGSGRVYNLEFNPPKVQGKDDVTGEPLIQRPDDREDVVLSRLKVYEQQTKPIIDFYQAKNRVEVFTGNTSDYLWPLIKANLHVLHHQILEGTHVTTGFSKKNYPSTINDQVTHTGQIFDVNDPRTARFETVNKKLVNKNFAIDLIAKTPVIVAEDRVVWSSGGGPLGHPKVFINLDRDEVQDCGYSGRRFIQKKFYDPAKHGPSINYNEYVEQLKKTEFGI